MVSPRFLHVLAALVLVTATSTALAGTQKVESKITYKNSIEEGMFIHEGEVKSALRKCERNREVRLYGEGSDLAFASDETNRDGEYRIVLPGDGIPEDYYTRVIKESQAGVICKGDESPHKPLN